MAQKKQWLTENERRQEENFFMKPSQSFYDSFIGCRVREVMPYPKDGLGREQFLEMAGNIIEEATKEAKRRGLSQEEVNNVQLRAMRQVAEGSLFFFCVVVLNLYYINHDYGYRLCLDVQENKWRRLWVIAREHYKSTIITCASTLWETLKNPNITTCIYSYKEDMASVFLCQIKSWCETNTLLRRLWPDVIWDDPARGYDILPSGRRRDWKWTSTGIEFKRTIESKELSIEAAGIVGSSKTGMHFSQQIFDDTETQKNVETPDAIDKLKSQVDMAFNTGQTGNLQYCFVGTFYARADVYYRMIKNNAFDEAIVQPCVDADGYPIHYTKEALEEKYRIMGPVTFATQEMSDPSFNSTSTFKAEWFRKWDPDTAGLNIYTLVDPSSGKTGRKHDFTVILTFGIDSNGNILPIHITRDKISLEKKFSEITSVLRLYHPIRIYYEQVSMQQDISSLEMLMDKYHSRFAITPFNPTKWGDKASRIDKLKSAWEMGRIWMPRTCYQVNYEGVSEDVVSSVYLNEYLAYPSAPHDDFLDAMASALLLLTEKQLQLPEDAVEMKKTRNREINEDAYNPIDFAIHERNYRDPLTMEEFEDMQRRGKGSLVF